MGIVSAVGQVSFEHIPVGLSSGHGKLQKIVR